MSTLVEEVESLVAQAREAADAPEVTQQLDRVIATAGAIAGSWSGSNLGYHALVYYRDFATPRAGHQFNREWGLSGFGMIDPGPPGWAELSFSDVYDHVLSLAGSPDLEQLLDQASVHEQILIQVKGDLDSIISTALTAGHNEYLERQLSAVQAVSITSLKKARNDLMPSGQMMTRDVRFDGTLQLAPHQEAIARATTINSVYSGLDQLGRLASQVAAHLRRSSPNPGSAAVLLGDPVGSGAVFVGHGRSLQWMALSQFLDKRLHLTVDEYNRIATAGVSTSDRLQEMLDGAAFAFLILTAEDEQMDGQVAARQNVVHEVGLFQGKLGLRRAIVMLEDGCEEFSNIIGLGQLRFTRGNISAAFEDVRAILEREGLLESASSSNPPKSPT